MKFYTDPNYFFELWCQEIQKDTAQQKREYKNKKRKVGIGGCYYQRLLKVLKVEHINMRYVHIDVARFY